MRSLPRSLTTNNLATRQIRQFDAFPKVSQGFGAGISSEELQLSYSFAQTQPLYRKRSSRGGALTIAVVLCLIVLCWNEARDYLYGQQHTSFKVDNHIEQEMQINFDATVAMPCHCEHHDLLSLLLSQADCSRIV